MCTFLNFSSNILVLDEITDFMDNQGSNKLINTISNLIQDVSSVFFVTHHTELNLPYDKIITVVKDEAGMSRLT
uniref:STRUCTURAL MAINTENANCE OF CHROMOSOMES PROTEIN n=1 Tax=Siphoviridae sp. ctiOl67 TaxID=2825622 RepID=A0A8S5QK70_9CAUD|nr:MAG TPA: STRUCTURAL MAINTENANCE OF CHROMOSOMES PROTEIN [Siphoviridae sp. ctiOl67]